MVAMAPILACWSSSAAMTRLHVSGDSPSTGTTTRARARAASSPTRSEIDAGPPGSGSHPSVRSVVNDRPAFGESGESFAGRAASPWPTGVTAFISSKLARSHADFWRRSRATKPWTRQRSEVVYIAFPMSSQGTMSG
jgi:hypothetical protein